MKKVIATILSCALLASLTGATDVEETQVEETTETSYEEVVESSLVEETEETESSIEEQTEMPIEESTTLTEVTVEETTVETEVTIEETTVAETVEETQAEIEDMYNFDNASYFTNDCYMYLACDYSVRASADPNASVIANLEYNAPVHILEMAWDSPWLKVEVNGEIGYINMFVASVEPNAEYAYVSDIDAEEIMSAGIGG